MTIKTKISILFCLSMVFTVIAGSTIFNSSQVLKTSFEKNKSSELITKGVFELNILTNELLNNHYDRTADQWNTRYDSLLVSLKNQKPLFRNELFYFKEIEQNLNQIKLIILKLYQKTSLHRSILGSYVHGSSIRLYQSKISTLLQNIIFNSQKLKDRSREQLKISHNNNNRMLYILISGFMMLIMGYAMLFFARILKPVTLLFKGVQTIGKGNFDYTIPETAQDEFGELSRVFNHMSLELKNITVSRDDLEKEIKERKMAENALETAHAELENRVEERTLELFKANKKLTREIFDRKQAEKLFKHANKSLSKEHAQRKMLSKNLIDLLEKGRRQVAMELHDHISQNLTSLKMNLEIILGKLNPGQGKIQTHIETAREKTIQAIKDVKNVSHGLWPATIEELGLVSSLRDLFGEIQEFTGLKINFFSKGIPRGFEKGKELYIYRIVQEALNNIIRHSQAGNVFVNLVIKNNETLLLSVEDDGLGFDQDKEINPLKRKPTLGLLIMKERTVQLGGDFIIESQQGKGTHVLVEMPV